MNTTSLLLNGRTAASISLLPQRQAGSLLTTTKKPTSSTSYPSPPSPTLFGKSPKRRTPTRTPSRDSPGWYDTSLNPTLDDIAARLNTNISKFEQWQGKCAQNVVMALMRPTPIVLFVFNPVSLLVWIGLLVWWFSLRGRVMEEV